MSEHDDSNAFGAASARVSTSWDSDLGCVLGVYVYASLFGPAIVEKGPSPLFLRFVRCLTKDVHRVAPWACGLNVSAVE